MKHVRECGQQAGTVDEAFTFTLIIINDEDMQEALSKTISVVFGKGIQFPLSFLFIYP